MISPAIHMPAYAPAKSTPRRSACRPPTRFLRRAPCPALLASPPTMLEQSTQGRTTLQLDVVMCPRSDRPSVEGAPQIPIHCTSARMPLGHQMQLSRIIVTRPVCKTRNSLAVSRELGSITPEPKPRASQRAPAQDHDRHPSTPRRCAVQCGVIDRQGDITMVANSFRARIAVGQTSVASGL